MPTTIERVVYTYDELSDKAKARARQDYVERGGHIPYEWWDASYDEFVTIGAMLGITIDTESVKTCGGGKKDVPNISFSGFSSQGDGASFVGSYRLEPNAISMITEHAPKDEELLRIATELTALQTVVRLEHDGVFGCSIVSEGRGCASYNMDTHGAFVRQPDTTYDWFDDDIVLAFRDLFRAFADWMYRWLEDEYDYLHSDDFLAESMAEETFDEDGSII